MNKPVALITGASRGIGKAVAMKLSQDGFAVGINFNQSCKEAYALREEIAKNGGEAFCSQADVEDFGAVGKMINAVIEARGRIDVLVNNAGIRRDQFLMLMEEKDWDDVIGVNLKGVFNCSKQVAFEMMKRKSGKIINITSVGAVMGTPGQANYAASKGGIISLTKTMARELARFNILVNSVAPGFIDTDLINNSKHSQEYLSLIPLGRIGKTEEVAHLISFIASDKLSYTTGHVFYVDGGIAI